MNMKEIELTADDLLPLLMRWVTKSRRASAEAETPDNCAPEKTHELLGISLGTERCHDDLAKLIQAKIKAHTLRQTNKWMETVHGPRTSTSVE